MKLVINLNSDNEATTDEHVANMLEKLAQKIRRGDWAGKVLDVNGNSVGTFSYESSQPDFECPECGCIDLEKIGDNRYECEDCGLDFSPNEDRA